MAIMKDLEKIKAYITRPEGKCWIGQKFDNGNNMRMVTRYGTDMLFECEYDGKSLGDEFVTRDISKALEWLYA